MIPPSVGRIVMYRGLVSNDLSEHPAIITRVWSDTCVNLTIFPDAGLPEPRTSVIMLGGENTTMGWGWPVKISAEAAFIPPTPEA